MGAWGTAILSDDTVRDVRDDGIDLFNRRLSVTEIREKILQKYRSSLNDANEGLLIWIGLARAQWDCGHLEAVVFSRIQEIVNAGLGLDLWAEQGQSLLKRRKEVLNQFLIQLPKTNPRPRKPRKGTKRQPIFQPGDCLAVRLRDGDWGAILVLQSPPASNDPYVDTYAYNLAGTLRYKSAEPPTIDVFEKREWLRLTHHSWRGDIHLGFVHAGKYRTVKDRFKIVGRIPLKKTDPVDSNRYCGWPNMLDSMYLQDRCDRGIRE